MAPKQAETLYVAFRTDGGIPQVVGRLVSMGLAQWPKGATGEQICELTEYGRTALAGRTE